MKRADHAASDVFGSDGTKDTDSDQEIAKDA